MRSHRLHAIAFLTGGLSAVAVISPVRAQDRPADMSSSVRTFSVPMPAPHPSPVPANQYGGLAMTIVAVGEETPGVPCQQCVARAGEPNIGLPWPVFTVQQGDILSISTWFESSTYTGPCTIALILKNGGNVVYSGTFPWPGGCQAGNLYGAIFTVPAPTATGFTQVIGKIAGGGVNKSGTVTFIDVQ